MRRLILTKLVHVTLVLLVVSFATMLLLDLTPGDPAYALIGEGATPEQIANLHEELGLDRPLVARYASWVGDLVTGDFGRSTRTREPVLDAITSRLPVTLELGLGALVLALLISVPLGAYTAYRSDGTVDRAVGTGLSVLLSAPSYLVALLLSFFFAVRFRWFPVTGWTPLTKDPFQNLRGAVLPVVSLVTGSIPGFTRLLRADMIATLQSDYILAARAKGLSPARILLRHALRPSSFSLITVAGVALGHLLAGTVLVETIFGLPGLGNLMIASILTKDFVVVQGVVMFVTVVFVLANTAVDLLYSFLDPRVRAEVGV